jgi:hypothetical protein
VAFPTLRRFFETKVRALEARARSLVHLRPETVGLRPQDASFAPSPAHFEAARSRLAEIDRAIRRRLGILRQRLGDVSPAEALVLMALVEREVDRARRAFGMFFEIFSQRGSAFGPALAAHDAIAADCYAAVRRAAPMTFSGPLLKPLTYMEHGFSPATMRRGVILVRLLGERNPFPVIRIPWDRDAPWQAVFLHEVAHNLQADLGIWQENMRAVGNRVLRAVGSPGVAAVYRRWHKEIFADLASIALGGPAAAWSMMDFLAHPGPRILTYRPGGAHPTGYLRVLLMAEMLRRMGFEEDASRIGRVWRRLYDPAKGHRIPAKLLETACRGISHAVDEIAFQTRRNLAQRALVDVIPFGPEDERAIRAGAAALARGTVPDLPSRFLVSASHYALEQGGKPPELSMRVTKHLARQVKPAAETVYMRLPQAA